MLLVRGIRVYARHDTQITRSVQRIPGTSASLCWTSTPSTAHCSLAAG